MTDQLLVYDGVRNALSLAVYQSLNNGGSSVDWLAASLSQLVVCTYLLLVYIGLKVHIHFSPWHQGATSDEEFCKPSQFQYQTVDKSGDLVMEQKNLRWNNDQVWQFSTSWTCFCWRCSKLLVSFFTAVYILWTFFLNYLSLICLRLGYNWWTFLAYLHFVKQVNKWCDLGGYSSVLSQIFMGTFCLIMWRISGYCNVLFHPLTGNDHDAVAHFTCSFLSNITCNFLAITSW